MATTLNRSKGGQFVAHVAALPGNPYDGHMLASIIPAITQQIGVSLTQVIADAGYRGHNAPSAPGLRVFTAGQKRGVTQTIKPALRRRATVEPVLGHLKAEHRMGRNYLATPAGDAVNAVLAAVGHNFRLLLAWLPILVRWFLLALSGEPAPASGSILTVSVSYATRSGFFTDDYGWLRSRALRHRRCSNASFSAGLGPAFGECQGTGAERLSLALSSGTDALSPALR